MRGRRLRFGLAAIVLWFGLLAWAAQVPLPGPLFARERINLPGENFHVVMGSGVQHGTALDVNAIGDDDNALQSVPVNHLRAEDFPILRYRFADFPRTLELTLVFRTVDMPDDVQTVSLPWPGNTSASFDLGRIPAWRGEIIELGFAQYPTAQLVPAGEGFRPFRFEQAELWSPSWRGSFGALLTDWFDYWPWELLSVSALGPTRDTIRAPAMPVFAALGTGLSFALAAWVFGWRRNELINKGIIACALAWVALDLVWLADFTRKHAVTEAIYAGKSWEERASLVPDTQILGAAVQVKALLRATPITTRILVHAESSYSVLRLMYFLRPLNVYALMQAFAGTPAAALPPNAILVFYQADAWKYDETSRTLGRESVVIPVAPLFQRGDLAIYRVRRPTP